MFKITLSFRPRPNSDAGSHLLWWWLIAIWTVITIPNTGSAQRGEWLTAKVSNHRTVTGAEINLDEAIQLPERTGVVQIRHEVWRIGIFHRRLSRFVLLHDGGNQKVFPISRCVADLPDSTISPHGFALLEAATNGWFGKTFHIEFLDPGVYAINAEWRLKTRGATEEGPILKSNPVVIFVKPSPDYDAAARRRIEAEGPDNQHGLESQERLERFYDENHGDPDFTGIVLSETFEEPTDARRR